MIRLGAFGVLIFSLTAGLFLFLMVKQVPRHEDAWQQARMELSTGQQMLLQCSHRCRSVLVVLLPGCVALIALSATAYVMAVRKDRRVPAPAP